MVLDPEASKDLPVPLEEWEDLEDLRPRWAALAAVTTLAGFSDSYYADEIGWHHESGSDGDIHVVPRSRGRAILYGHAGELADAPAGDEELQVLRSAPAWVRDLLDPWPEEWGPEGPGFVYWLDDDTWQRAPYPGDPDEPVADGASVVGRFMFDDDQAVTELLDWASQWIWDAAGAEWDGDEPELVAAAHTLIDDLREWGEERQAISAFLDVLAPDGVLADLDAAAEAAAEFTA